MIEKEVQTVRVEEELEERGVCALTTLGVSMRPLFKTHRDVVLLKKPDGNIKKYDVVLYKGVRDNDYVLHRVIKVKDETLVIRGDNTFCKEYVPCEAIIAVLFAFNRKGKRYEADNFFYKLYSKFWNFIYPLRFILRITRICLGKIKRKIMRKR